VLGVWVVVWFDVGYLAEDVVGRWDFGVVVDEL